MRISEIVRIDSRGRITMPSSIRQVTGFSEGMYVMLIADLDAKEVRITPFADPQAKLVEFHFTIPDVSGSLAQVASILAANQVDLLSTTSRTLRRRELAEWVVVADVSKCKCSLGELQKRILSKQAAKEVGFRDLSNL